MGTTWNPSDKNADITLTNGNLTAQNTGVTSNALVRATSYQSAGKYYFEIVITNLSTGSPSPYAGLADATASLSQALGQNAGSYAARMGTTGTYHNATYSSGYFGGTFLTNGDVLGVAVDFTAGAIWMSRNGAWGGSASISEIEAADTSRARWTSVSGPLTPAASLNTSGTPALTLIVAPGSLSYTVPTGFTAGWPYEGTVDGTMDLPLDVGGYAKVLPLRASGAIAIPLEAAGVVSTPGHGSGIVSVPLVAAGVAKVSPNHATGTIALPLGVSASGRIGFTGVIDAALGTLEADMVGYATFVGAINAQQAGPEAAMYGAMGFIGSIDAALGELGAEMSGYREFVGAINSALGTLGASLSGYMPFEGAIDAALGTLDANLVGVVAVQGGYRVVVVNTRTGAVTEYDGLTFNSLIEWDGVYYGANDDGIFALTGADDDGTAIAAYARTGLVDHGADITQRVPDVYVSGSSTKKGVLSIRVEDGATSYAYDVPFHKYPAFDAVKAILGRGLRTRYRQYQIANTEGAELEVDRIDVNVNPTERRRKR